MTALSIKDVTPGATIAFRSKRADDLVNWQGTLLGVMIYQAILPYGNPAPYNAAVRQADSSVSSDLTTLTYFLIKVDNDAVVPTTELFADEWIEPGSLIVTTLGNQVTILVQDPENNPQKILSLLASGGYASTVVS